MDLETEPKFKQDNMDSLVVKSRFMTEIIFCFLHAPACQLYAAKQKIKKKIKSLVNTDAIKMDFERKLILSMHRHKNIAATKKNVCEKQKTNNFFL